MVQQVRDRSCHCSSSGYCCGSVPTLAQEILHAVDAAKKKKKEGVLVVAQWLTNPTRNHEVEGLIPGLAQWVKDLVLLQATMQWDRVPLCHPSATQADPPVGNCRHQPLPLTASGYPIRMGPSQGI